MGDDIPANFEGVDFGMSFASGFPPGLDDNFDGVNGLNDGGGDATGEGADDEGFAVVVEEGVIRFFLSHKEFIISHHKLSFNIILI